MTESALVAQAETKVRELLKRADGPVSSAELANMLSVETVETSRSLVRLALQRLIAHGAVDYDLERRYSLRSATSEQT